MSFYQASLMSVILLVYLKSHIHYCVMSLLTLETEQKVGQLFSQPKGKTHIFVFLFSYTYFSYLVFFRIFLFLQLM